MESFVICYLLLVVVVAVVVVVVSLTQHWNEQSGREKGQQENESHQRRKEEREESEHADLSHKSFSGSRLSVFLPFGAHQGRKFTGFDARAHQDPPRTFINEAISEIAVQEKVIIGIGVLKSEMIIKEREDEGSNKNGSHKISSSKG